ncbi:HET-domain-containing protein, partial [Glonium stellatum]
SLGKIQQWKETCIKNHSSCAKNEYVPLPTRVIDVGNVKPNLWHTARSYGAYTALSHCWGKASTFTTTTATLTERTEGMDIATLPQTFHDAIVITRKLGLRYLWIDSICIIQDDHEDWKREAANMLDVYKNSYLTLSAMSAENSHEGFLHRKRSPSHILATRGWTLQELILSNRVLHYSTEQMIWDCERRIREDGLSPTGLKYLGSSIKSIFKSNAFTPYIRWYHMVENYTSRNLTYSSDKFPAISGLARETQKMTSDEYLAGLWRNDLTTGLMWVPKEKRKLDRASRYRAPSWSWAALDGPISYNAAICDEGQEFRLEVLEVKVKPAGFDKLGAVESGFIRATCCLKETKVLEKNVFDVYEFEDGQGWFCPDDGERPHNNSIWCMKVINKIYSGCSTVNILPHGLALQPTMDSQNEFTRVGTFEIRARMEWFSNCEKRTITIV